MLSQPAGIDHKYRVDRSHEQQNLQRIYLLHSFFCISLGNRQKAMETVHYFEKKKFYISMTLRLSRVTCIYIQSFKRIEIRSCTLVQNREPGPHNSLVDQLRHDFVRQEIVFHIHMYTYVVLRVCF